MIIFLYIYIYIMNNENTNSVLKQTNLRFNSLEKLIALNATLVGDVSADQVASATTSVNAATSDSTLNTIMKRDSSANFSANSATLNNLTVNGSTKLGNDESAIGFFGKTPVVQQSANNITELLAALSAMGLIKTESQ
jgi:hypothetical protein